jgi:hypothetical protein
MQVGVEIKEYSKLSTIRVKYYGIEKANRYELCHRHQMFYT